jgi:hypothetical protein
MSDAQQKEDSKPRINIDVNKKYDEKGNIILYDSTYSYSWSDQGNDIDLDSVFKRFHHHLELYNYFDDNFSPHSYIFPGFPDNKPEDFFRFDDSSSVWQNKPDTILRHEFYDDYFNWDFDLEPFDYYSTDSIFDYFPFGFHKFPGKPEWHFQPFGPNDSIDFWYNPYEERFPDFYFDELDNYLKEMRKYFEQHYGVSPYDHDKFHRRDLKEKDPYKPKKNTTSFKT